MLWFPYYTERGLTMTTRIARFIGLLFSGLFAGFLVAVLVLENSLRSFDGAVYTQVRQVELDALDRLAAFTLIPALIATAALVVLGFRARSRTRWPAGAALVLMVAVFALTVAVNLPINADQLDWSVRTPPADWADVRDRWQLAHAVRTVAAVSAFALLAAASVFPRHTTGRSTERLDQGASDHVDEGLPV
jgi:uncharacterized membrane protein